MNYKTSYLIKLTIVLTNMFLNIFYSQASSQEINKLIKSICLYEFNQELLNAKKNIPKGSAEFTCDCFINRINNGKKLDKAKVICKDEATRKYNL
ncbi:hypothetical protein [Prochlorococcus marinus]|uniref:hypothetical protein n=1 Tax=Prochlorococcus marinus TaxID=1219 RepID=UPI0022B49AC3|nr:hypothetical protein [Prochlorococcus marinus]